MTTREITPKLARVMAGETKQSLSDKAAVFAFGALQWPWLLRSLSGGPESERLRLLDRLGLAPEALPNLGSWKADSGLLHLIVDIIENERPQRVVEFGIGATSLAISAALRKTEAAPHLGFDQHNDFVDQTRVWLAQNGLDADLRFAPLTPSPEGWPGLWYETGPLDPGIDLMVIDGPPWTVHPFTRGAAETLFGLLSPGGIVLLDDAARLGERMVAAQWRKLHPNMEFVLWKGGSKGTLIGRRR